MNPADSTVDTVHPDSRSSRYADVLKHIDALLEDEDDWIAAMATVASELHNAFSHFHWTGFYRAVSKDMLVIGPYQGGHGCLRIPFSRGVCGAAARTRHTQLVRDLTASPRQIDCSSTKRSAIVVPVVTPDSRLHGVLDVDSELPAAADEVERQPLAFLAPYLGRKYAATPML